MFRQDLEGIVDLFKVAEPNSVTALSGEGNKTYTSFDEMKSREGASVRAMRLTNETLGIDIKLSASAALSVVTLSTFKESTESQICFYQMRDFLEARRSRAGEIVRELRYWVWLIVGLCFFETFRPHNAKVSSVIDICCIVSVIIAFGVGWFGKRLRYRISLNWRHEDKSFLTRNRDQLAIVVFTAILSATLGVVGTLLIQHLSK